MNPLGYTTVEATPSIETYRHIRQACGLSAKSGEAAALGLPRTLFAVQVLCDGVSVGMGRVVGDGGCFFQVVDIAVLPEHRGRGLGRLVMAQIMGYLEREVPDTGYVSLIADGLAHELYASFGFVPTAPASIGMALPRGWRARPME